MPQESQFPVSFFPKKLQDIILEVSETYSYPIDHVCSSVLVACSTSIGNSNAIHVKNHWIEKPCIFIALIGSPGVNKSAPLTWAMMPIEKREKELYKKYMLDLKEYDQLPEKDQKAEPILVKTVISDATPEAVVQQLKHNARGVLILMDELSGFLNTFQRYSKGNDEQFYLSAWSGKPVIVDRKTSRSIRINDPIVNIIGTIQPGVLERSFAGKEESGFFDRWLLCYPKTAKKEYWSDFELDYAMQLQYEQIIGNLQYLSPIIDQWENITPNKITYSKEGLKVLKNWQILNTDEVNKTHDDIHKAIRAKIETYIHRFSLITELIEWAVDSPTNRPSEISPESVVRAIELCEYFITQALQIRTGDAIDNLNKDFKDLVEIIPMDKEFTFDSFLDCANMCQIKESTARKWLKKNTGVDKIFIKIRHGIYARS